MDNTFEAFENRDYHYIGSDNFSLKKLVKKVGRAVDPTNKNSVVRSAGRLVDKSLVQSGVLQQGLSMIPVGGDIASKVMGKLTGTKLGGVIQMAGGANAMGSAIDKLKSSAIASSVKNLTSSIPADVKQQMIRNVISTGKTPNIGDVVRNSQTSPELLPKTSLSKLIEQSISNGGRLPDVSAKRQNAAASSGSVINFDTKTILIISVALIVLVIVLKKVL
jgi:hypothetical protein